MASNTTDVARLVKVHRIDGYSTAMGNDDRVGFRWTVDGYEWEIRAYPSRTASTPDGKSWVGLQLILRSEPRTPVVRANLDCMITSTALCYRKKKVSGVFSRPKDSTACMYLASAHDLAKAGHLSGDSITVQSTITVHKDSPVPKEVPVPSSNLDQNLGELLRSEMGADVTFLVRGESFAAHKVLLAARSPVFRAQFFGDMKEKLSHRVEVEGMQPALFRAMLQFIYTDTAPELDQPLETAIVQDLLDAADRYGLDSLKKICENALSSGLTVDTVATILILAERHNCLQLKASCVEFIVRTPAVLDAVLATEGYEDMVTSCPSILADLLKAARGRKN